MSQSRTKKSTVNTMVAFAAQFLIILLGFLSRRVLINSVGVEYLGINGLMTNILTIFSLAESGIGLAIGYSLYKPLADNDIEKVKSLMRFYRDTYRLLAIFTAVVGLAFYPFLPFFLKDNTVSNADLIYFLFLGSSVCSYLWSYKITLNNADQNKYLYTIANTVTQIAVLIVKVFILKYLQDYILYLIVELGSTLIKNIIFTLLLDHKYPFLKDKQVQKLQKEDRHKLFLNIKALFLGKIGYVLSQCSDNLVISSIVSISAVGLYSNYTTLITSVSGFLTTFTSGVTASMGNLVAKESKEKVFDVYSQISFINYWLYTFSCIGLFCLIEPFIAIWLGSNYIMGKGVLIVAVLTFYLKGINSAVDVTKNAAGLYHPDRFIPMIEAGVNLVISILLALKIGLLGVLIGTLVSFVCFSFWIKPFFVYRDVFKRPFREYLITEGTRVAIALAVGGLLYFITSQFHLPNVFFDLIVKAVIVTVVTNLCLVILFFKTRQFRYIVDFVKGFTKKFFGFLHKSK